jgi:hypothetical protein
LGGSKKWKNNEQLHCLKEREKSSFHRDVESKNNDKNKLSYPIQSRTNSKTPDSLSDPAIDFRLFLPHLWHVAPIALASHIKFRGDFIFTLDSLICLILSSFHIGLP